MRGEVSSVGRKNLYIDCLHLQTFKSNLEMLNVVSLNLTQELYWSSGRMSLLLLSSQQHNIYLPAARLQIWIQNIWSLILNSLDCKDKR